jgi:hypothetical protein
MKSIRLAKTLTIAALSTLTLMAGASHADSWGYRQAGTSYFPNHAGIDTRGPNHAQPARRIDDVDARQQQLMRRIMQGMESGRLSRHEARDLIGEQKNIERLQRHFMADGRLDRREYQELERRLDIAALEIRAEKRDNRRDNNWR